MSFASAGLGVTASAISGLVPEAVSDVSRKCLGVTASDSSVRVGGNQKKCPVDDDVHYHDSPITGAESHCRNEIGCIMKESKLPPAMMVTARSRETRSHFVGLTTEATVRIGKTDLLHSPGRPVLIEIARFIATVYAEGKSGSLYLWQWCGAVGWWTHYHQDCGGFHEGAYRCLLRTKITSVDVCT